MALYYVPRVTGVEITPNPVKQNQTLKIAVQLEDVQMELYPYVSFAGDDNLAGADYIGGRTIGKKEYVYAGDAYAGEETMICQ